MVVDRIRLTLGNGPKYSGPGGELPKETEQMRFDAHLA
ncbi:unnamed protein product, partial [marine sediment metagenome]